MTHSVVKAKLGESLCSAGSTLVCAIAPFAFAAVLGDIAFAAAPPAMVDLNQHGLTGAWHNPATPGQGIQVEVYPNAVGPGIGYLQGNWVTFGYVSPVDYASGGGEECGYWDYGCEYPASHHWYAFGGNVTTGQSSATLTLWTTAGGNFNALPAPSAVAVGTVTLTFLDCVTATLEYAFNANGSDVFGTVPLVRLIPNVTCSASVDDLTRADFGHSGNWFDPAISGQGFVFEVNPIAEVIFFTWQTYSLSGRQRWFTGVGDYVPGSRTLPVTLYETTGGLFDSVEPAARTAAVGAATVTFLSCDSAQFTFAFSSGTNALRSGAISLSRVGPTPAGCGTPITTAEGEWLRAAADDGFIHLVVLENGETWLTYPGSGALGRGGVMHGTLASGGGVFAGELRNYDFTKDRQSTVAVMGTFEPKSTLKGSAVVEGEVVTLTRRYATDYDSRASALIATGTWDTFYAADRATINVDATGEITGGSSSGCVFAGTLRPRPSGKNVHDLSVTYGGAGCALGSGAATGIGLIYQSYAEPPDPYLALTILAEKNDRTAGLWWEGSKR